MKHPWRFSLSAALLIAVACAGLSDRGLTQARGADAKVLGLDKVIAFVYSPAQNFDLKQLKSATLVGPRDSAEWQFWQQRGVVMGVGHTWYDLLRSPVDKAVTNLVGQDPMGKPGPLVMIDEFGFDYGGEMDQKSAEILRQAKRRRPEQNLAVFEMRGPIPPVLAEAYRDAADLVMVESYVASKQWYWWIATQVWSARHFGILPKTIVVLGIGKGGNPGENWAETKEEIEQQIRFVRLIAPESPGIGFYSGTPELLASADALAAHFSEIPTDGAGLPADLLLLAQTFSRRYSRPTLLVSPALVQPNYKGDGLGQMAEPKTMRSYLINLGDEDAHDVKIRLRNPPALGGNVFAEGVVPLVPKRSVEIGALPVTAQWKVWVGQWLMDVEAPGCEVQVLGAGH